MLHLDEPQRREPRILFVTANDPEDVASGGDVRAQAILRSLRRHCDVSVYRYLEDDLGDPRRSSVRYFKLIGASVVRALLAGRSHAIDRVLYGPPVASLPPQERADQGFDIVWFFKMRQYLRSPVNRGVRSDQLVVLDLDDLDDRKAMLMAAHGVKDALERRSFQVRAWSHRIIRHRVQRQVSLALVCSDLDRARSRAKAAQTVPNTVRPTRKASHVDGRDLLLLGNFLHRANLDAAEWIVDAVLPMLCRAGWDGELRLVGRMSAEDETNLCRPQVLCTGFMPSLDSAFEGVAAALVPVRFGSGTRVKALDALARGVPLVGTPIGLEGLDVEDGQHALIADTPRDFAEACLRVLNDAELRRAMGLAARHLWKASYSPEALDRAIDVVLAKLAVERLE